MPGSTCGAHESVASVSARTSGWPSASVRYMNRPGKVTDNAYIESFFHSMKADIVHGLRFTEDRQIEQAVRAYVPFYNGTRLHSSLNYVPPATFERLT